MTGSDAFLAQLYADPWDDDTALVFADWLDDERPGRIVQGRMPGWFRRAWVATVACPALVSRRVAGRKASLCRASVVANEIGAWLTAAFQLGPTTHDTNGAVTTTFQPFRSWGLTDVAGVPCFAYEAERSPSAVLDEARLIASRVGGVPAFCREAILPGCARGLVFPPEEV